MNTKFYLDTRRAEGNTPAPLKIAVSHKGKTAYISLDIKLSASQWDETAQKAKNIALNLTLQQRKKDIDEYIYNRIIARAYDGKNLSQIISDIRSNFSPKQHSQSLVKNIIPKMELGKGRRTAKTYMITFNHLRKFCDFDSLSFDDITYDFIMRFEAYLIGCGVCVNTRILYHRTLHHAIRTAIRYDYTKTDNYYRFSLKREASRHRYLTLQELQHVRDEIIIQPARKRARDIFMLMFYLRGINFVDLMTAKKSDIVNGRLVYVRAKTKKRYSIRLEPEAIELIEKYKGKGESLLDIDNGRLPEARLEALNQLLKVTFPEHRLTTYWARHTWATLAFKAGVSKQDVSLCLGHSFGASVTDIYIDYQTDEVVDEANRKVLDFIK